LFIFLRNSKDPTGLRVPINLNIEHLDDVSSNDGEVIYVLKFTTAGIDKDTGLEIGTTILKDVSQENIKQEIQNGLAAIGKRIDWDNLSNDEDAPRIVEISPKPSTQDVSIQSLVKLRLLDYFPTEGINPATIKLKVNGVDVTPELRVKGDLNEYYVSWLPKVIT